MTENKRLRRTRRLLVPVAAIGTMSAGVLALTATPAAAVAGQASACGYWANVNIFNTGYKTQGCAPQSDPAGGADSLAPSVSLAGGPTSAFDDGAKAIFSGVATMFSSPYDLNDNTPKSGTMNVSVSGGTFVASAIAKSNTVGPSPFWTRSPDPDGGGPLLASAAPWAEPAKSQTAPGGPFPYNGSVGYVRTECSGNPNGTESGTTTINNGFVDTSTASNGYPTATVMVPTNPAPNTVISYTLDNVGDHGYIIFNEQIQNPDGTLTINGSHMVMQGNNAYGDIIIAQTKCGFPSEPDTTS